MNRFARYIAIGLGLAMLAGLAGAVLLPPTLTPWLTQAIQTPVRAATTSLPSGDGDGLELRTAEVARGDVVYTVQAAGTLNATVLVEVGSQISGQISQLNADFNSAVAKGQVIARIAPDSYEAKVAQAQAELEMAQTSVAVQQAQIDRLRAELAKAEAAHASAQAETARAQLALDDATRDLKRKQPLVAREIVPASEWERVQNTHRSAQAGLSAQRALESSQAAAVQAAEAALQMSEVQLGNARAQVKQKEALLRQAQIDLDHTIIRAPISGTVINRKVNIGQTVAASLQAPTLFTIAQDLTKMQVEASVIEADVSRFAVAQPVTFAVDAYPGRRFTGTVRQIRKAPEVVQNVVTYTVIVDVENPDQALLPGMTANLDVVAAERKNVLTVPNAALRFRPPGSTINETQAGADPDAHDAPGLPGRVFALGANGRPVVVPLRLGLSDGRVTEILEGDLAEGDTLITGNATRPERRTEDASSSLLKFRWR